MTALFSPTQFNEMKLPPASSKAPHGPICHHCKSGDRVGQLREKTTWIGLIAMPAASRSPCVWQLCSEHISKCTISIPGHLPDALQQEGHQHKPASPHPAH